MVVMIKIAIGIIAGSLIAMSSSISLAENSGPTLGETLSWMDGTYNPHRDSGGGWGHGREEIFSLGKPFKRRSSTFTYDGCTMEITRMDDPTAPAYSITSSKVVSALNLKDIDPSSIKAYLFDPQYGGLSCDFDLGGMKCTAAEVEFQTFNQKPLIENEWEFTYHSLVGDEHENRTKSKSFVSMLYFDDADYTKRFVRAFRHAIDLCGGKPSPF